MNKKLFLLLAALLAVGQNAFAYDFSYTYQGKTLFYTIQGSGVSVDNPVSSNYYSYVTGDVVIPDSVENNGTKYAVISIGWSAFEGCSGLTSVTIPNSVTSIGWSAFEGCSGLTSVTLPNSITYIGSQNFMGCTSLTSVTIPNSVTSIGGYAFWGCSGLTSVTIPNSVTSIGSDAFEGCSGLTSVTIPNSVTSIGGGAFSGCTGLTSVTIGGSVTSIGSWAFSSCSGLTSVTIPNSVTSISDHAFYVCSSLTSVTIGGSVTSIGGWAFYGCSSLTSVTIPNSVTIIYSYAFEGCSGLTSVYCEATTPPTLGSSVFDYYYPIYVPYCSVSAYQNATNWSNYASRIQGMAYMDYSYSFVSNNETMGTVSVGDVDCDSNLTVTATANSGYQFTGWSDGGTGNPRTFHLTGDTSVTAVFDYISYAVVGLSSDASRGSVSGSDTVYSGETVTLTATPNYGYHFARWNDNNQQNPRTVTATANITYTAYFDPNNYTVTVLSDNEQQGTVGGGGTTAYLGTRTVYATPNTGYHFDHWSDGNTSANRTVTVEGDTTLTAYFSVNQYTVTIQSSNETRGITSEGGTYNYGDSITLVATANYGYHFQRWQDNNTENPRTVMVTGNKTYTATFLPNSYTVTVHSADSSQGTVSGSGAANYMSNRHITATPAIGHHFSHWSDGDSNANRYITVLGDTTLTAFFEVNQYTITIQSNDETRGTTSRGGTYNYGDSITLVATANYGYHFQRWQDNNTENPRTVMVTGNKTYTATFLPNSYTVTLHSADSSQGTVSGSGAANYMSNRHITATPAIGHHFSHWSDGDSNASRYITVLGDTTLTAFFEVNQYTITIQSNDETRGITSEGGTYNYGDSVTLVATANYGYHFQHWQDSNTDNPRTVVVSGDIIYTAYFDPNSYTVTLHSADSSQGTVSGSGVADYLEEMHITATPATGYHFSYWSDGDSNASRDITVLEDTTLIAYFEANRYTITVITDNTTMGTVSDGGTYNFGDTILIEAFPVEHYHFTHWNDGNRDNPRLYRVENDITLTAFFAIDTHTVHVISNDIARGMVESTGTQFAYGTPCTVTAIAYTGYVFTGWSNGITANPYTFAVLNDVELTALFEEEGTQAITDIDAADITVYAIEGRIVVHGAEGMEVSIFDVMGREVIRSTRLNETPILPNGIYLIKIASLPARKIIVVR